MTRPSDKKKNALPSNLDEVNNNPQDTEGETGTNTESAFLPPSTQRLRPTQRVKVDNKLLDSLTDDKLNLNQLKSFYQVVQAGTITRAARKMRVSQPALSRQITLLEDSLGQEVLFRTTQGLYLTKPGEILFEKTQRILRETTEIRHELNFATNTDVKSLKIGTTAAFGTIMLPKIIGGFLSQYPEVTISIIASNELLDLYNGEADILIWPIALEDEKIELHTLETYHYGLFASPEYLQKFGEPQTTEDLKNHQLLAYYDLGMPSMDIDYNWHLKLGTPKGKRLKAHTYVNNSHALNTLGEQGFGIISASQEAVTILNLNLVRVLEGVKGDPVDLNFMCLKSLGKSNVVKQLRGYLRHKLKLE